MNRQNSNQSYTPRDWILVLLPAILFRGFVFYIQCGEPVFQKYLFLARNLSISQTSPFCSSPVYTFYLFVAHSICGLGIDTLRAIQAGLGIVSIILLMRITCALYGRKAGLWAGILFGWCVPVMVYESDLVTTPVDVFAQAVAAWLVVKWFDRDCKWTKWIWPGFWIGVSTGIRPNMMLAIPLLFMVLAFRTFHKTIVTRFTHLAGLGIGIILAVAPITLVNWIRSGEIIPVTASGGAVFYSSNNYRSTGLGYSPPPALSEIEAVWMQSHRTDQPVEHAIFKFLAERASGRTLTHNESSRFYFNAGRRYLSRNIGRSTWYWLKKILFSVNNYEVLDTASLIHSASNVRQKLPVNIPAGFVIIMGLFGIIAGYRRNLKILIPGCFLATHGVTAMLFYVNGRLRVPQLFFLAVFAGAGVCSLIAIVRNRQRSAVLSLIVLTGLIFMVMYPGRTIRNHSISETPSFLNTALGLSALHRGDVLQARVFFEKAVMLNPLGAGESWNALAGIYSLHGDTGLETTTKRRAAGIWSSEELLSVSHPELLSGYESLMARARYAWFTNSRNEAKQLFEKAVQDYPDSPDSWFNLAVIESSESEPDWQKVIVFCEWALERNMQLDLESHRAHRLMLRGFTYHGDELSAERLRNQMHWEASLTFSP